MAIPGNGLRFSPLFWVFHDQWKYYIPNPGSPNTEYNHWGHIHFFMPTVTIKPEGGDAFSGVQKYHFTIKDVWGPRSNDPNQSTPYRVIGKPKWFFHIQELWRRVFIQPWDLGPKDAPVQQRRGLKYDASPADKIMGPFREGINGTVNYAPYFMSHARSLPVEYFQDSNKDQAMRDNYVAARAQALLGDEYDDQMYGLNHGNYLLAKKIGGHHAGVPAFSDALYIWPVIEYQRVVQMDWDILPGSPPDVPNIADADDSYGDGWDANLTIPFTDPVTQKYRSPFGYVSGRPLAFGRYNDTIFPSGRKLVEDAHRLKYSSTTAPSDSPLKLPGDKSDEYITEWHNPWGDSDGGGIYQQCIGGIVQAKARVLLEHRFGYRTEAWVNATQYLPTAGFAGSDYGSPAGATSGAAIT